MFGLDRLAYVYVSSARRGFMAVATKPSVVDHCTGSSSTHHVLGIKQVTYRDGCWNYADDSPPQLWLEHAWSSALALSGGEPWRVYLLEAANVAARLDAGESVDDIRGFDNRLEPWQAVSVADDGEVVANVRPAEALAWERTDGWRAAVSGDGRWVADGSRCNADESILEYSSVHFDELPGEWITAAEAMAAVDSSRPWE